MIEQILSEILSLLKDSLPELGNSLNAPASNEKIQLVEHTIGKTLPEDLKTFYRIHDGESGGIGLFFGLSFLSLDEAIADWKTWEEIADDISTLDTDIISIPTNFIKENYANRFYFPISTDYSGNHIGIDLDPDEKGTFGQVINFGRDENIRYVIAFNITDFLQFILFQLKKGNYRIDKEGDQKQLILKKPKNSHFLDTLKELKLPFGIKAESNRILENKEEYEVWFATLSDNWKEIVKDNCKPRKEFGSMTDIKTLYLIDKNIDDLKPLEKFVGLRELILTANPIEEIESLVHLKDLKKLYLAKTKIENIQALCELENLGQLSLYNTNVTDISCLVKLKKLKSLSIESTSIKNLGTVSEIKSLTELDISQNNFESFDSLKKLTNLVELNLSQTNVADISFISSLKKMERLTIYETDVIDYSCLVELEKLRDVTCSINDFMKIKDIIQRKISFTISGEMSVEQKNIWNQYSTM